MTLERNLTQKPHDSVTYGCKIMVP